MYVKTPSPGVWHINDQQTLAVFLPMATCAEEMADRYGALVVDGTHFFSGIQRFRNSAFHYASPDLEFVLRWEGEFQDLIQLGQFAFPDLVTRYVCDCLPDLNMKEEPPCPGHSSGRSY